MYLKDCRFDSWSGHIPRLLVQSWVRVCMRGRCLMFLSLSTTPLSKIKHILGWRLKKNLKQSPGSNNKDLLLAHFACLSLVGEELCSLKLFSGIQTYGATILWNTVMAAEEKRALEGLILAIKWLAWKWHIHFQLFSKNCTHSPVTEGPGSTRWGRAKNIY